MYHDPDFAILAHILPRTPVCIDAGANSGQSIHSIKHARPMAIIHSFEPNPEFSEQLFFTQQQFENVHIHLSGLGKAVSNMDFFLPVINGVRYTQETTMRLESLQAPWVVERFKKRGDKVSFEKFNAPIEVGDSFNFRPDLIKIDVEGVESEVVAGFEQTIHKYKPILFVENGDWDRLAPFIDRLGYLAMMPNESYSKLVPFRSDLPRVNSIYVSKTFQPPLFARLPRLLRGI
ncbi:FkbM family methyltransferase [Limnobacter parvus]|uniref:FkbM family methyltransferase n=1 Tax=Limnobacter parvus TaxID=2939690 RepID=A0ABT1XD76_9BURK|nr:FkbM family methyltransferase [Limnobacter parvus]MCR2745226.1 FkbM family methyltransferase [Limnobacter parvus]